MKYFITVLPACPQFFSTADNHVVKAYFSRQDARNVAQFLYLFLFSTTFWNYLPCSDVQLYSLMF